jgi:hypothetical protein
VRPRRKPQSSALDASRGGGGGAGAQHSTGKRKPSLLASYKCTWNPRQNHFEKRSDVRPKEEKKETIVDMSAQKLAVQRAEGFSLVLVDRHLQDLVSLLESFIFSHATWPLDCRVLDRAGIE